MWVHTLLVSQSLHWEQSAVCHYNHTHLTHVAKWRHANPLKLSTSVYFSPSRSCWIFIWPRVLNPLDTCISWHFVLREYFHTDSRPGSSVGIMTGYGLDGPGIESRWKARFSAPVHISPGAHPASCTMGTGSFPGVKSGRGVTLTPHPLLVP